MLPVWFLLAGLGSADKQPKHLLHAAHVSSSWRAKARNPRLRCRHREKTWVAGRSLSSGWPVARPVGRP
jgi:hypothetical protein